MIMSVSIYCTKKHPSQRLKKNTLFLQLKNDDLYNLSETPTLVWVTENCELCLGINMPEDAWVSCACTP